MAAGIAARPAGRRIEEWLGAAARRAPGALALRTGGRDLDYAALDGLAAACARRLAAAGVGAGDRVATTLPPGRELAALLHGAGKLGAVPVPLDPRLTAAERDHRLRLAAPRLVVDEPLEGPEAEVSPRPWRDPDEPHTVLFTSGTSGAPKPVALTVANHAASAGASAANLGTGAGDRWLCVLPLFHVGGLAILLRSAIAGGAAVVHASFAAEPVRRSLESGEATVVSLVPTQLRRLLDAGLERTPALRAVLLGGGPVPPGLLGRARERGLPVVQTYGMTETASQIATLPVAEALAAPARGARPLEGVELRIGPGGEILVRGPMVAPGALGPDGWLHTGDRGRLDGGGRLRVEGRLDDVIVTGGENVAAAEVEAALLAHPAVAEAAVAGREDPEWGRAVTAWVVLRAEVSAGELAAHCRARLAPFKVPKAVHVVERLPRTASGKVVRRALGRGSGPPQPDGPGSAPAGTRPG